MDFKYIQNTTLYSAFSDLGKRIFLPDGIFYWSGRAKTEGEINGTIGTAFGYEKDFIEGGSSEWLPCYLKEIKEYSPLNAKQMVPYAPIGGLADIREIWKNWLIKKSLFNDNEEESINHLKKYITLPLITAGVTNGIHLCCSLFLNPGEIIISPNKRWENYNSIIQKYLGAKILSFEFFQGDKFNLQGLSEAIDKAGAQQNKIIIILNFPNNPTGYVPLKEEGKEIVKLLKEKQQKLKKPFVIIIDDAYEPYIYNERVIDKSIFYNLQQIDQDVIPIKLDGITKELLMYGGRIGFITIGLKPHWVSSDTELDVLKKEINNKLEGINRSTISNCNLFYQTITQKIFTEKGTDRIIESRNKVKNLLKIRYQMLNEELNKIKNPNISIDPNAGGFFLFLNLNPEKYKAKEFADHLLKKYKIGIIPVEKLKDGINGIRIAYCSIDIKHIPEVASRINEALNDF